MTGLIEPGSDVWRRKISPSKVAAILGVSPYESPLSIWHLMTGAVQPDEQTARQARGHYLEHGILQWFFDQHPDWLWIDTKEDTRTHPRLGWIANMDGEAYNPAADEAYNTEGKTDAGDGQWGKPGTDEVPPHYAAQALASMHITGHRRTYFAVLNNRLSFAEYIVDYDADWCNNVMEPAVLAFEASLTSGIMPPLDAHPATYDSLKRSHPDIEDSYVVLDPDLAVEYVESRDEAKVAVERADLARNRVLKAMNVARYADCAGVRIARRQGGHKSPAFYDAKATRADLMKALERSAA